MKSFFLITIAMLLLAVSANSVSAAETCMPVFGGGITTKQICPTPASPTGTKLVPLSTTSSQTKGGQTVYPAGKSTATPSTGPTETSYAILAAMAVTGIFVLRKTRLSS